MPTVANFRGISIYIYRDDHDPPHFHAIYGDFEALIDINELKVLEGNLPTRQHRLVDELLKEWSNADDHKNLSKIPGL